MCLANSKKLSADATGTNRCDAAARRSRRRVGWVVWRCGVCGRGPVRRVEGNRCARYADAARRSARRSTAQPAALPHMYPRPLGLAGAPLAGYAAGRNGTFFRNGSADGCRKPRGVPARDADSTDSFTYHYTVHDVLFV